MATHSPVDLPSRRTIAFALALVRSKPAELVIAEYIDLLRQHVAKGRRENALSSAYHHLDRSSYWRSEHERVKWDLKTAESENVELRREINTLKAKVESAKVARPKKRKRADEDTIPYPRSPKKFKQNSFTAQGLPQPHLYDGELEFGDVGEVGTVFLYGIHRVQTALAAHQNKTDTEDLVHGLLRAAGALPEVVATAFRLLASAGNLNVDSATPVLVAAARSFRILIAGFTKLTKVEAAVPVSAHATYALIKMYQKLLDGISTIPAAEPKKIGKSSKLSLLTGSPVLDLYVRTLGSLVDELDPTIDTHQGLFEGLAYVVLSLLGSKLYCVVFGHPRGATIEDEIMASIHPVEVEGTSVSDDSTQRRDAKREAPYLVHLLERIMTAAPAYLGAALTAKLSKAKASTSKAILAVAAKERLQRTLVNCIFGKNEADENDPFKDCLKMPSIPATPLKLPTVREVDVDVWFKEEMWRLLGWEILAKEGDR